MRRQAKKFAKGSPSDGSALILTVVLTSLLAMVGVLFVMMARVNQIATSGISESRELDSAIETVIAKISEELALDIPRKGPNDIELSEYYDYPGLKDKWLASLEPHQDGTVYKWRQISDVTGYLEYKVFGRQDVDVELPLAQRPKPSESWVRDYPQINVDEDGDFLDKDGALATEGLWADADGDGVADSKWIELDDITSSKGKPIYAAIRIVDNGGMLNVNTAYKFDPNEPLGRIDGSSQMQINLMALSWRAGTTSYDASDETALLEARANYGVGVNPLDLDEYEENVVWRYNEPNGVYTPFDISDELEIRNRFLLNHEDIDTRLEPWGGEFRNDWVSSTPFKNTDEWFVSAYDDGSLDPNYAYRHIATTYNMDRIINPSGGKMVNVNRINDINDVNSLLYPALLNGLDPCLVDADKIAAQIAVNLKDFRDNDSNVTSINVGGSTYYGFERPCVYISELAHKFVEVPNPIPGEPNIIYKSYAIELYKPYLEDNEPNNWRLVIDGNPIGIDWSLGSRLFHVIRFEDPNNTGDPLLDVPFNDPNDPPDPNYSRFPYDDALYVFHFGANSVISLQRLVDDVNGIGIDIVVDSIRVPDPNGGWLAVDDNAHSIQRDITLHKCIRRLWSPPLGGQTLGSGNNFQYAESPDVYIQAHPANEDFTNVGEIGMVFRKGAYYQDPASQNERIGYGTNKTEEEVRLNLADPYYQNLFQYITVFDPASDGINNDGDELPDGTPIIDETDLYMTPEYKVPGRININTAPWYVLAQLPWVSQRKTFSTYELAKEIVGYRDEIGSFESIGQLCQVGIYDSNDYLGIDYYSRDDVDQAGFPDLDLPSPDGAEDDFEERDLIFARISNLVTVRSDVFTAYILVRIGTDGPQKRVIAILDRSDVYLPTDRVKIVAVHPVADPR